MDRKVLSSGQLCFLEFFNTLAREQQKNNLIRINISTTDVLKHLIPAEGGADVPVDNLAGKGAHHAGEGVLVQW